MNRLVSKPKVFLFASEIAAFIGQNKWDYVTPFERLWKKCDKGNYQAIISQNLMEIQTIQSNITGLEKSKTELQKQMETGEITKRQYTLRANKLEKTILEKQNQIEKIETRVDDIDLSQQQKLEKYLGNEIIQHIGDKSVETDNKRIAVDEIIEKLDIKDVRKLENIKQHAESFINKTHGTLKEDDAIAIYEKKYKVKLDVSQQFNKRYLEKISENSEFDWYICGKVDGLYINPENTTGNYIVEVKNRTRGFFNNLRDYEKTQIQLYIWMLDVPIAKLVEKYESKIRVTQIYKDKSWIDNTLECLEIFISAFENRFLNNTELKTSFTMSEREDKQRILKRLYLNPVAKHLIDKTKREMGELDDDMDEEDNWNGSE